MSETSPNRLEGWKAIAQHVGRSERAAQRWHAERGMPVYRVPGGRRGSVYALREEIDAWLRTSPANERGADGADGDTAEVAARWEGNRRWLLVGLLAAVSVVSLAAVVWAVRIGRPLVLPARAGLAGNQLTAWDAKDAVLWTRDISPLARPEPQLDSLADRQSALPWLKVPIVDVTGDGIPEIVVVASDTTTRTFPKNHELQIFTAHGERLWRFQADRSFNFQGHTFTKPWIVMDVAASTGPASRTVWSAFAHHAWWPSFVMRFDATGAGTVQFVNSGLLYDISTGVDERGQPLIFASGINNEYAAAALAVLRPNDPPAVSPQASGGLYACDDCATGPPLRYFVFPRSELGALDESIPYNRVFEARQQEGITYVLTVEYAARSAHLIWRLSKSLDVESVRMTDSYLDAHRRLETEGRLDHTVEACPERQNGLRVRVWSASAGGTEYRVPVTRW